ncbi:pyruvate dehydrogenase complex protein X component, mitochondrial [Naviculisporaceae sp. PSN 640]
MASFAAACRISSRVAGNALRQDVARRGFRTSAAALAAQNFTMPALSPTMTEGNIATWRIKEGDKFVAGDVLLEIETDKATMDVEAQEDGILMKIMQGDGSKGVQVGTRIAVIAEEGDDISTLEIPADKAPKTQNSEASVLEPASAPAPEPTTEPSSSASTKSSGKIQKQTYPLYPSVAHLLKVNGLEASVADSIPATGPNGRLLKGDVLAYLGKINAETPSEIESRYKHNAHLDLSNIKVAKAPEVKKVEKVEKAPEPAPRVPEKISVSLPVSLDAAIEVQTRVQKKLGIYLPLSTFISRASDLANEELPLPAGTQPTADELFNQILGLDKVGKKTSRGQYLPQIAVFEKTSFASKPVGRKSDIIDLLAGAGPSRRPQSVSAPAPAPGSNFLSLHVPKGEERRAKVFLERLKLVLEVDPGRLVL